MINNLSLLLAFALAALTPSTPGAPMFSSTVASPVFIPPSSDDKSPVGKRNRCTVAQAKRQALKLKRRKAHRMRCR